MYRQTLILPAVAVCNLVSGGVKSGDCTLTENAVPSPPAASSAVQFVEISEQAGIRFIHKNGAAGRKYMPETMGSGLAFLDYDNDGWQDLVFVNGTNWPGDRSSHDTLHLYRNNGNGTFTDVTKQSGL